MQKLLPHQFGHRPFAPHADTKATVIHFATVCMFNLVPHFIGPVGKVFIQPIMKHQLHRSVEPDECVSTKHGSIVGSSLYDIGHFMIVEARYHRAKHHAHAYTCMAQFMNEPQTLCGGSSAGFHHPPQIFVEAGDAHQNADEIFSRHFLQQIFIPQHAGIFGNHTHGLIKLIAYFQQLAGKPKALLCRLVAIGIATEANGRRIPLGMQQKFAQQLRRIFLHNNLAFKIEAGAVTPVFMSIAGIAVNAAMLTTLVRIHAVKHAHIRAVNFIHQRFGVVFQIHRGFVGYGPFINGFDVLLHPVIFQKPVGCIDLCATPFYIRCSSRIGSGWLGAGIGVLLLGHVVKTRGFVPAVPLPVGQQKQSGPVAKIVLPVGAASAAGLRWLRSCR